jgi:Ca-activated chloride channel family protein
MAMIFDSGIFLSPAWLLLIPGLPLLHAAHKKYRKQHDKDSGDNLFTLNADLRVRHPLIRHLLRDPPVAKRGMRYEGILQWLIISCLLVALAEPVMTGKRIPDRPAQRDITFIVDASVSMLLKDYEVNGKRIDRMQFLKNYLDRFVQQLDGDRVSIIVFGDQAYTYVPMTDDHQLTRRMIARIQTTMAGRFNALGEAIALGIRESAKDPDRPGILILFTDADRSTDLISPRAATELASEAGLPLYTITIGALSYQAEKEEKAGLVYHPADNELLEQLATMTGARNYLASDNQALTQAVADIDNREKFTREVEPRYFQVPLYQYPLSGGLLLIVVYQLLQLGRIAWKSA